MGVITGFNRCFNRVKNGVLKGYFFLDMIQICLTGCYNRFNRVTNRTGVVPRRGTPGVVKGVLKDG
jgi:hypothetical protein